MSLGEMLAGTEPMAALASPLGAPVYDRTLYLSYGERTLPWEYNGWKPESLSWKQGCYIHAGLSGYQVDIDGPEALAFLSSLCTNSFARFPVGSMKHAVMCTDDGLIASHAILQRNDESLYRVFAAGYPWLEYQAKHTRFAVRVRRVPGYLFQVAGPTSLAALEEAAGESLRDIAFLRFRPATIAGRRVEIGRIGMAGTLAYEVRGPMDDGAAVYDAIFRVGRGHAMERLGWATYFVNHIEGGFPQAGWTFFSAAIADPDFNASMGRYMPRLTGSVDPADLRARFRTPVEVGWEKTVKFDHDFIGRAAIEREMADPRRRPVTLCWDKQDVVDIYASLLQPGEEYKLIDLPVTPSWRHGFFAHADAVLSEGALAGYAAGTIYSYHFRDVLSMASIDRDHAEGDELTLCWGDHGGRIKQVRATVAAFPYIQEGRNDSVDTRHLA